jgi:hypothetical protein
MLTTLPVRRASSSVRREAYQREERVPSPLECLVQDALNQVASSASLNEVVSSFQSRVDNALHTGDSAFLSICVTIPCTNKRHVRANANI